MGRRTAGSSGELVVRHGPYNGADMFRLAVGAGLLAGCVDLSRPKCVASACPGVIAAGDAAAGAGNDRGPNAPDVAPAVSTPEPDATTGPDGGAGGAPDEGAP